MIFVAAFGALVALAGYIACFVFAAQTGKLEPVAVSPLGEGRYRISGPKNPIELRYSPQGEWLELDSTVADGRKLSYRRK